MPAGDHLFQLCECGSHHGPMTDAQRELAERSLGLVNGWLTAIRLREEPVVAEAMDSIHRFIAEAPRQHDSVVRMTGLITILAKRCAIAAFPARRGLGFWSVQGITGSIDDLPPTVKLSIRLMIAFGDQDDRAALDLLLGFADSVAEWALPDELFAVFLDLTGLYVAVAPRKPKRRWWPWRR